MGRSEDELIQLFLQDMARLGFSPDEWIPIKQVPVGADINPFLIDCILVRKNHIEGELRKLATFQKIGIGKSFGKQRNARSFIRKGLKNGAEIWLLEAKTLNAKTYTKKLQEAVGQVLVYRELFLSDYPSTNIKGVRIIHSDIYIDDVIIKAIERIAQRIGTEIRLIPLPITNT